MEPGLPRARLHDAHHPSLDVEDAQIDARGARQVDREACRVRRRIRSRRPECQRFRQRRFDVAVGRADRHQRRPAQAPETVTEFEARANALADDGLTRGAADLEPAADAAGGRRRGVGDDETAPRDSTPSERSALLNRKALRFGSRCTSPDFVLGRGAGPPSLTRTAVSPSDPHAPPGVRARRWPRWRRSGAHRRCRRT